VVEFGAAAGLPSLVALSLGTRHVVATDYPSPSVVENLTRNLTSHCTSFSTASTTFKVISHTWGDGASMAEILSANNGEGFDIALALAAECLWRHELHSDLATSLYRFFRAFFGLNHHILTIIVRMLVVCCIFINKIIRVLYVYPITINFEW
jgi:predicted nicotinamide N-methyase